MLHRDFDRDIVLASFKIKDVIIKRRGCPVNISDELLDTAFVVEGLLLLFSFTGIDQIDLKSFSQESHFPKPLLEDPEIINGLFKNLAVRKERDRRSGLIFRAVS